LVEYRRPLPGFSLSQLAGGAPGWLTRRIAAKYHLPVKDLYSMSVFPDWFGCRSPGS
jgi:hypothetical protein